MIRFRRENPSLVYADFEDLLPTHSALFVYTCIDKNDRFLIVLNMSDKPQELRLKSGGAFKEWVICNYNSCPCTKAGDWIPIRAWEACLLRI